VIKVRKWDWGLLLIISISSFLILFFEDVRIGLNSSNLNQAIGWTEGINHYSWWVKRILFSLATAFPFWLFYLFIFRKK